MMFACPIYPAAVAVLILAMGCRVAYSETHQDTPKLRRESIRKKSHRANILSARDLGSFVDRVNIDELWKQLTPILKPRRPDTKNIRLVRSHINNTLTRLKGWNVEYDTFVDNTPVGRKTFSNILASTNPNANKKLILACHYDSKDFRRSGFEFIGATDSAVPCAMLLEIARALNSSLKDLTRQQLAGVAGAPDMSLDLIFFDGEEAFKKWSDTDSLYGSRHLANKWSDLSGRNVLRNISLFVLLDLIGHSNTRFVKFYSHRSKWFDYCKWIEAKLRFRNLLSHRLSVFYRHGSYEYTSIEDDHIPFLENNVPILHLISAPFPTQWHTRYDNEAALDPYRIDVITKILTVFVAEYLHLSPPLE